MFYTVWNSQNIIFDWCYRVFCSCFIVIEIKWKSRIFVWRESVMEECRMRSETVLDIDANLSSTYVGCVIWNFLSILFKMHSLSLARTQKDHYIIYIFHFHKSYWQQCSHHTWMQRPRYMFTFHFLRFSFRFHLNFSVQLFASLPQTSDLKRTQSSSVSCWFFISSLLYSLLRSSAWISHLK